MTNSPKPYVVVVVEGGLVQDVLSKDNAIDYVVCDLDICRDGSDEDIADYMDETRRSLISAIAPDILQAWDEKVARWAEAPTVHVTTTIKEADNGR